MMRTSEARAARSGEGLNSTGAADCTKCPARERPVITVSKITGFDDAPNELHAGGSYLFGFAHDNGFFTEFRVGGGSLVPQLKLGVGWAVEIK